MSNHNIAELKSIQQQLKSRKEELLKGFTPFRNGILERLEQFTQEASEEGLQGIRQLMRHRETNGVINVGFMLNEFDLVLITTDDAYPQGPENSALTSKVFLYISGNDINTPVVEIDFQEQSESRYSYAMRNDDSRPLARNRILTLEQCGPAGEDVAEIIIDYFYGFRTVWHEKPTLKMMLQRQGNKTSMGFRVPG